MYDVRTKMSGILSMTAKKVGVVVAVKDLITPPDLRRFERGFFKDENVTFLRMHRATAIGRWGFHQRFMMTKCRLMTSLTTPFDTSFSRALLSLQRAGCYGGRVR
jgi:hypothetical protein